MKVFISWSGAKSGAVAIALRGWLPQVINVLDPFVSSQDIAAGSQWQREIATQLEATFFGIVCVTEENQHAPWLSFEAGALAKTVGASRVVPLAIDVKPSGIKLPLAQFQAQPATRDGVAKVVLALNGACESSLDPNRLERAFAKWWPDLEADLVTIEQAATQDVPKPEPRTERELLEETLDIVRALARRVSDAKPRKRPSQESVMLFDPDALWSDHPLLGQIASIAAKYEEGKDTQIFRARRGREVVLMGPVEPPQAMYDEMVARARAYDAEFRFVLGGPQPQPASDASRPSGRRTSRTKRPARS